MRIMIFWCSHHKKVCMLWCVTIFKTLLFKKKNKLYNKLLFGFPFLNPRERRRDRMLFTQWPYIRTINCSFIGIIYSLPSTMLLDSRNIAVSRHDMTYPHPHVWLTLEASLCIIYFGEYAVYYSRALNAYWVFWKIMK